MQTLKKMLRQDSAFQVMRQTVTQRRKKNNIRIYTFSFGPHITHFLAVVAMKRKHFEQVFVSDSSEHSVKTEDDNNKVSYFNNALELSIFKLVLYFNSSVFNDQIIKVIKGHQGFM